MKSLEVVNAKHVCLYAAPALIFDVTSESDGYSLLARWQLQYDGGPNISKFNIMVLNDACQS